MTKTKSKQARQLQQLTSQELITISGGAKQAGKAKRKNRYINVYSNKGHYSGSNVNSGW